MVDQNGQTKIFWMGVCHWLMVAACVAGLILFISLILANISFVTPLQLATTGFEEESIFAIWKYINNLEVYSDQYKIPFAASYFNWFFYFTYGELTGTIQSVFSLTDEWIPTITRVLTITFSLIGAWTTGRIFQEFLPQGFILSKWIALLLGAFLFCGPLVGFYGLSTRPDVLAYLLEILALRYFLHRQRLLLLSHKIVFALLCYLAWSTKQSNITVLVGVLLYLLWDKRWREAIIILGLSGISWLVTFYIGGDQFLQLVLLAQFKMGFAPNVLL